VGRFSADTWANRAIFDLEWSGGAPPEKVFKVDPFTEKWGQNWGIPNYRWDELRRRNFDWWRTRIGNIQKVFHLYRIDHVLGFFRIYSFPWTPDRNAEFLPLNEAQAAARTGGRLPGFKQFPDDTPEHKAFNQAGDLIGLQEQLSTEVQHGLLPILGSAGSAVEGTASRPKNQQAYDFYLRSVAQPHDPAPNKQAITKGLRPRCRSGPSQQWMPASLP